MKKQVEEWLLFSKTDLLSAKKLMEDDTLTQSAAFHVQQSVEKSFKAVIESLDLDVPRIHDVEKLLGIVLEKGVILKSNLDMLPLINDIYIETRYPGDQGLVPNGIPSIEFIADIFSFAEDLLNEISEFVRSES